MPGTLPYASLRAPHHTRLRPMLGAFTGMLIGAGVAIGSGIFRNPGLIAQHSFTPIWIIAAWLFGGFFFLLTGLMSAELSTRFPDAGGEYVYLHHAYGRFIAFFFGWAYTVFIVGGGVATMAVGLGDFACGLAEIQNKSLAAVGPFDVRIGGIIGAAAVLLITWINITGLRTGAVTQNVFTVAKVLILLAIVVAAMFAGHALDWFTWRGPPISGTVPPVSRPPQSMYELWLLFAAMMMPVMWCYEGTTDSVKMTEEIRDPRRSMPLALVGTAVLVTTVYVLLNWAFMRVIDPAQMATSDFVAADVLGVWLGPVGKKVTLGLSICVVLGALSSTIVSCVRVPFALGRDRMTFAFIGRMSPSQAPVGALLVSAGFAVLFALAGVYETVLSIYTIASGVLFGLVNLSLLVFRLREKRSVVPQGLADHFRCPFGAAVSIFAALVQFAIAFGAAYREWKLALYTLGVLAVIALIYLVWPKPAVGR